MHTTTASRHSRTSISVSLLSCADGLFRLVLLTAFALNLSILTAKAGESTNDSTSILADELKPWIEQLHAPKFGSAIHGNVSLTVNDKSHQLELAIVYVDHESFIFEAIHDEYHVILLRDTQHAAMILPKHKKFFLTGGALSDSDEQWNKNLRPKTLLRNSLSGSTILSVASDWIAKGDVGQIVGFLGLLTKIEAIHASASSNSQETAEAVTSEANNFRLGGSTSIEFHRSAPDKSTIHFQAKTTSGKLELLPPGNKVFEARKPWLDALVTGTIQQQFPDFAAEHIARDEFERTIARGLTRAMEVLAPAPALTKPAQRAKSVENGRLEWIDGHRVVSLWGNAEEIGLAHGQLLRSEAIRCLDSVLHAFGTVQTIASGKWFRHELEAAYKRLSPHIPERHKQETRSLASAIDVEPSLMEVVNVFPELFHCSGFAVFGDATKDGKLYHGRVLDYMTTIGLQDSATTFIVAPDDHLSFANIGYAGFIGSVSGMNEQKVSLGEMGGKGEGEWDGAPMATLMRRALEECNTLEEVKLLWEKSPRTCEYYYVFADGKSKSAVGVAATPEKIEFVQPGQAHTLLGDGIKDSLVLSAGNRLQELRKRVVDGFGKLDVEACQNLMCRPVAMKSNLHNVLFVPEDEVLYVANASHTQPAADRPYTKIDLREKLIAISSFSKKPSTQTSARDLKPGQQKKSSRSSDTEQKFLGVDSVSFQIDAGSSDEVARTLKGLQWNSKTFEVTAFKEGKQDFLRFPSPLKTGNDQNDQVILEWYRASPNSGASNAGLDGNVKVPAILLVHESGRKMPVGRMIARGFGVHGLHAFMIHLPHYGKRLDENNKKVDAALALKQSVMDVRRALDAIAAIPEVDPNRISLQGTSLGGFVAATAAGIDDKPYKVFMLLARGDLASVMSNGQKDAQKFKRKLLEAGLTEKQVLDALDAVEPLHMAHRISKEKAWLYAGRYDDVVPLKNSELLAQAIGLSESHFIRMDANHYSGILLLPTILEDMSKEALATLAP